MALTKTDLNEIRSIVIEGFETMANPRFEALENDVSGIKKDVTMLRSDVSVLKSDVGVLKEDVSYLKSDVRTMSMKLDTLEGQLKGLESDIREIYMMLAKQQAGAPSFDRLTLEQKILQTYEQVKATAKQAGVTLPH